MSREEIHDLVWIYTNQILGGKNQKTASGFRAISEIISGNPQIIQNKDFFFKKEEVPAYQPSVAALDIKKEEIVSVPENISKIKVEKISPDAKLPTRAHTGDAGLDLYANEYYSIAPYQQALVATGIKMIIPYGYAGLIWDKSGLATSGITTLGGLIDTGYRGEVKVIVKNLSEDIFNIVPGQKIAQILIQKVELPEVEEGLIEDKTERQAGAFGSSGQF